MPGYEGGAYLEQGLSSFGSSIAQAMDRYHRDKQDKLQKAMMADQMMTQLSRTPDPNDPSGRKMIVDPKAMERFHSYNAAQKAAIVGGIRGAQEFASSMRDTMDKHMVAEAHRRQLLASANHEIMQSSGAGAFTPKVVTLRDESGNPYIGPNGKPVQAYYRSPDQVSLVPGSDTQLHEDEGGQYWVDDKGNRHYLSAQQEVAKMMSSGTAPQGQQGGPTFNVTGDQTAVGRMVQFGKPSANGKKQQAADQQEDTGSATRRVKVKSPDGRVGSIPASQLEAAKKQGYQEM